MTSVIPGRRSQTRNWAQVDIQKRANLNPDTKIFAHRLPLFRSVYTLSDVAITFHPAKRDWTLQVRGLDFSDAEQVFAGPTYSAPDTREDYGEVRIITVGLLADRMVIVGWTLRGDDRRVFRMRKANDREQKKYRQRLG